MINAPFIYVSNYHNYTFFILISIGYKSLCYNIFILFRNCEIVSYDVISAIFWVTEVLYQANNNIDFLSNIIRKIEKNLGFSYMTCLNKCFKENKLKIKITSFSIFYEILNLYNF